MRDAVKMVSVCADEIGNEIEGHALKGVMSADGVQEDEHAHQEIGEIGEFETSIRDDE